MAPKFLAPKVWRRPYTSIYNDNYRFGNSLYEDAIYNLERKYQDTMARSLLDRPEISLRGLNEASVSKELASMRQKAIDSALSNVRSISTSRASNYEDNFSRRQLQHSESFNSYQSKKALADMEAELEESIARRSRSRSRRSRPESAYASVSAFEDALLNDSPDGHNQAFLTERWYKNSLRSVSHDLYPTSLIRARNS